jgi:hypothetical protein
LQVFQGEVKPSVREVILRVHVTVPNAARPGPRR